jgi:tRNA A37 threonylcarbamoyladenosine biosynthesis protein TsaE
MKVYPIAFSSPLRKGRLGGVECLAHIDAYRLSDGGQLEDIGVLDYFKDSNCITVIEWADRVSNIWPDKVIKIEFKILKGDKREIKII